MAETPQTRTLDSQVFVDVFNSSPIGIVVENLEGQPFFVNPALCSRLGFSQEEMHGNHFNFSPPTAATAGLCPLRLCPRHLPER